MNSRTKKVLVVLCLGCLILVWRVVALIEKYGPKAAEATQMTPIVAESPDTAGNAAPATLLRQIEHQRETAQQSWGRNPFSDVAWAVRPKALTPTPDHAPRQAPAAPELRFNGTSKSGEQWMAAVQGDILRVGDLVQGRFKVIRITRHTLTLESEGWTFIYQVGNPQATAMPLAEDAP